MTKLLRIFFPLILVATLAAQGKSPLYRVLRGSGAISEAQIAEVETLVQQGLDRLAPVFPGTPTLPFTVHLHPKLEAVPEPTRHHFHRGTSGIAILARHSIHIVLQEARRLPPNDLRTVVDHEIVHILLHQYAGKAAPYVPRWLHEGLAQDLSGRTYLGVSEDDLAFRIQTDRLFRFRDLRQGFPSDPTQLRLAYAQSFSFVAFLRREIGMHRLLQAVRESGPDEWFIEGLVRVTDMTLMSFTDPWKRYVVTDSGAIMRFMLENCFSYTMILAFVLLAMAGVRRWNRDYETKLKLEREEVLRIAAEAAALDDALQAAQAARLAQPGPFLDRFDRLPPA